MQGRNGESQLSGVRQAIGAMPLRDKAIIAGSLIAFGMFFLDPLVLRWARELDPNVRHIFWTITDVGKSGWVLIVSGTAVLAFVALGYRATHRRLRIGRLYAGQIAAFIFLSIATTGLFAAFCKLAIGRARPRLYDQVGSFHFSPFAFDANVASFPSGHATTTFALATALAVLWPRYAVPLFTAAAWIAASRFLMGAHYVSDVVAGALAGTVGTLLIRRMLCTRRSIFQDAGDGPCLRGKRIASRFQARPSLLPVTMPGLSGWLDRVAPERTPLSSEREDGAIGPNPPPAESSGPDDRGRGLSRRETSFPPFAANLGPENPSESASR
ncbi:undecaprenyl pyrophosphate phosphatase [Methyloligella halotolerans]|uniref:Undecaprenyl pyrophosphate phosphatase n=2 Tax=Methyloligella halotolerans TaxID=1177755 RepID=A0A1E2RYQ8_9HYPH|nr:undecaprenyl pyrophosphate phosphatase [Methyloligella halotolerans]